MGAKVTPAGQHGYRVWCIYRQFAPVAPVAGILYRSILIPAIAGLVTDGSEGYTRWAAWLPCVVHLQAICARGSRGWHLIPLNPDSGYCRACYRWERRLHPLGSMVTVCGAFTGNLRPWLPWLASYTAQS